MATPQRVSSKKETTTASLGFEVKPWQAADALRNNIDATEYKHTARGGHANYVWVQQIVRRCAGSGIFDARVMRGLGVV